MIHAIIVFWLLFGSVAALLAMARAGRREEERNQRIARMYTPNQPWKP